MKTDTAKLRNIGISAHIDSGKTTLTERILFYSGKIRVMHEVKGKDGVGAVMDSMELERERGITIASAATNATWKGFSINVIDTPGHVDFTVEVERALRVLDGAIMVLCAVGGVQSQSITVDRQMKRYGVPRLAFINKCDRAGANPARVAEQMRAMLGLNAVALQIPIGLEDKLVGIIDLVEMRAIYYEGQSGRDVRVAEIPAELMDKARAAHEEMLNHVSLFSDELTEAILEGREIPVPMLKAAIRAGTIALKLVPVLIGSAYKNKGVQTLLDAVTEYLPSPLDVVSTALDRDQNEKAVPLVPDSELPPVVYAFKLEEGKYGQLTYIRIYQGRVKKGVELTNTRTRQTIRVGRLVRMHSDEMEDLEQADSGDIVALFGIDCAMGDSFTGGKLNYSMVSMYVPKPVVSLSVKAPDKQSSDMLSKALNRFTKEDPTFKTYVDPESNQTIIEGMGELHLDIYIERMRREYNLTLETGKPQVAYREAISTGADFEYTHKKQTGGSGQFARVGGHIEPLQEGEYEFVNEIKGGVIPKEFIPSCDKGFLECLKKGSLIGFPITGIKVTINDGAYHPVDSSDLAFRQAAIGAFRETYNKLQPVIMEPIMKVSVEGPEEFQGQILAGLNQRRGMILGVTDTGIFVRVDALVPLSEMFGYSTALRSSTQGKAEFSMEFSKYDKVPAGLSEELKKIYADKSRRVS